MTETPHDPLLELEPIWDTMWMLANDVCRRIETERPDLVVVLYKSGALVWHAVETVWQATNNAPLPPAVGLHIGPKAKPDHAAAEDEDDEDELGGPTFQDMMHHFGDVGCAEVAVWAAGHAPWRQELAARIRDALGEDEPQRVLVVDDVLASGATAAQVLGLLWAVYPEVAAHLVAALPDFWREDVGWVWVQAFHPRTAAAMEKAWANYTGVFKDYHGTTQRFFGSYWRQILAGFSNATDGSLGWTPLTPADESLAYLSTILPGEEWLDLARWTRGQIESAMRSRMAAAAGTHANLHVIASTTAIHTFALSTGVRLYALPQLWPHFTLADAARWCGVDEATAQKWYDAKVAKGELARAERDGAVVYTSLPEPEQAQ